MPIQLPTSTRADKSQSLCAVNIQTLRIDVKDMQMLLIMLRVYFLYWLFNYQCTNALWWLKHFFSRLPEGYMLFGCKYEHIQWILDIWRSVSIKFSIKVRYSRWFIYSVRWNCYRTLEHLRYMFLDRIYLTTSLCTYYLFPQPSGPYLQGMVNTCGANQCVCVFKTNIWILSVNWFALEDTNKYNK